MTSLKGLVIGSGKLEDAFALGQAMRALPDGAILGYSEEEPCNVCLMTFNSEEAVLIERTSDKTNLVVNPPEGSKNIVTDKEHTIFEYRGMKYHVRYDS